LKDRIWLKKKSIVDQNSVALGDFNIRAHKDIILDAIKSVL